MNGLPHIPSPALNGLLDAISNAAEWDEQISEGKSLSEREEAVLQGLELLSRQSNETG
jgi:hypothetical protein